MTRTLMSLIVILFFAGYAPPGPVQESIDEKRLTPAQRKVRSVYLSQIGVREHDPNSGKEIEQYLSYVKLKKGEPWCAAFVCWVLGEAGIDNPRSGWSPSLFPDLKIIWRRQQQARITGPEAGAMKRPESGDVFGLYFPEKGRIAHAGFVDEWQESWVITVEGNTNDAGSREGDGVYKKRRLKSSLYQVARFIPDK